MPHGLEYAALIKKHGFRPVIDTRHSSESRQSRVIEARSNLSMSLDRLAAVFLGLSAVTLLVALGPLLLGFWPIMVAAVLHLVVVGWCMRLAWRGNWARERIVIDRETLTIDHFDVRQRTRTEWPSAWVRIEVEEQRMGERRVQVTCHGRRQVIGDFLPVAEKLALADALKESLRPFDARGGASNYR
jgi:uncharacterized membrane protein